MKHLKYSLLLFLTLTLVACSSNFLNKSSSELTPFEGFTRTAAMAAIRIAARQECSKGNVGLKNEMLLALGPIKQYADDKDLDGLIRWAADTGLTRLNEDLRNDLYPIVQDYLDNLQPCALAPESLECKNFWTNAYGESLAAVVNGCYQGALRRGSNRGIGASMKPMLGTVRSAQIVEPPAREFFKCDTAGWNARTAPNCCTQFSNWQVGQS